MDNTEDLLGEAEHVVKIAYSFFLLKFLHWVGLPMSSKGSKGEDPFHVHVETE